MSATHKALNIPLMATMECYRLPASVSCMRRYDDAVTTAVKAWPEGQTDTDGRGEAREPYTYDAFSGPQRVPRWH